MSDWGGTNAESLKNAIDNLFEEKIPINEGYRSKLVFITADGTSVNTGKFSGLMNGE